MVRPALVSVGLQDVTVLGELFELTIGLFDLRKEVCVDVLG